MRFPIPVRWIAVTIFLLSSVLNYLDRQILATMASIWQTRPEFPFTYADYGASVSLFGLTYAVAAPFMGLMIDRIGLNRGMGISVALWSLVSLAHGFVHDVQGLLLCRGALGAVEASGISAAGKVGGLYLKPQERAMGAALSQLGLSLGAGLAPAFTVYFAYQHNWRWAFFGAAILGLIWIPVWLFTSKAIPPGLQNADESTAADASASVPTMAISAMLADPRLWALMAANGLSMTFYSLWTNWAPVYLVQVHHLSPQEASHYSWAVPLCGYLGALLGGSLSWRFVARDGLAPIAARKKVCGLAATIVLFSALIPLLPTPLLATIGMSLSYFWISAWSTNLYTLPVDIYGADRAAFGVSGLVFAYGAMQAIVSRPLGRIIGEYGFQPVLLTFALLPLSAYIILRMFIPTPPKPVLS